MEREKDILPENINKIYKDRLAKLLRMQELGINPYPDSFEKTHRSVEVLQQPELLGQEVSVAGRLMSIRKMGKINFAHIQDEKDRLQLYFSIEKLGQSGMEFFNRFLDIGDIVGAIGVVFKTRTKETTINVEEFCLLSKCLRLLPEKFHGLRDPEILYRQRYLDLLTNPETRRRFEIRTRVVKNMRLILDSYDFTEVETPILQTEASGASAKPFITHHNALDLDLYLRLAPETYLKRLLVGGLERVYEIGRNFRNEGIDASHLQDFTMLEFYAAYWNARKNLAFTENLIKQVALEVTGKTKFRVGGKEVDFSGTWPIRTYREVVLRHSGVDIDEASSIQELREIIKERNIPIEKMDSLNLGQLIDKLYKTTTRPYLIDPQFLVEFPTSLSPLARGMDKKPGYVDQFQLLVGGWEVAKGYSELVDPIEQRKRLVEQATLRREGDEEAMPLDEDYIKAMEYGMPPNSGVGIGIDRLVVILTETENLRNIIFFPLTRPK